MNACICVQKSKIAFSYIQKLFYIVILFIHSFSMYYATFTIYETPNDRQPLSTISLDASQKEQIIRAIQHLSKHIESLDILVYNITPQASSEATKLQDYLDYTVKGLYYFLSGLEEVALFPEHTIIPTSSKAKQIELVSPEIYTSKQALFAMAKSYSSLKGKTFSILWLGKKGTPKNWRWLYPNEISEQAWECYMNRKEELLVGDFER